MVAPPTPVDQSAAVVNVDGERSLIAIKALQGGVGLLMASDGMEATAHMGSFEIEDLLAGGRSLQHRHLATSVPLNDAAERVGQDLFFEADEMLINGAASPSPPATADARPAVLRLSFVKRSDTSPLYANVDTRLGIQVCAHTGV